MTYDFVKNLWLMWKDILLPPISDFRLLYLNYPRTETHPREGGSIPTSTSSPSSTSTSSSASSSASSSFSYSAHLLMVLWRIFTFLLWIVKLTSWNLKISLLSLKFQPIRLSFIHNVAQVLIKFHVGSWQFDTLFRYKDDVISHFNGSSVKRTSRPVRIAMGFVPDPHLWHATPLS